MMRLAIEESPIDVTSLITEVSAIHHGAIATFIGTVRNVNDGKSVHALEYAAYETMALRELERIVAEALNQWAGCDVAVVHRIGMLQLGDVAVAVVAGHPHRAAAFDACRYVVEELKRRVPIWKREHYADGTLEWIDPTQGAAVIVETL